MARKKEPPKRTAARMRKCRLKKLNKVRRQNEDIFRVFLEQLYCERNLKPADWLAAEDFFAACDINPAPLRHLKTIESSTVHIGTNRYAIVRPAYLLQEPQ